MILGPLAPSSTMKLKMSIEISIHRFTASFWILCLIGIALVGAGQSNASAQDSRKDYPERPKVAAASDEGQKAIQTFAYPENLKLSLFAAEPDVANPVAFHVDFQGRVFVCESYRQSKGIEDNRKHSEWLNDDLAAQSVADRVAYIKKHLGEKAIEYTRYDDRIRLLIDKDQDGKVDESKVFANRFNQIESGTGAGVLSYRGKVYYTCIPDLWSIVDSNGDGISDQRRSLHNGYGVRFAFRGHDSHGLIVGPDGRLYFSIGDRGYNVQLGDRRLKDPASGAVFRCELDGTGLEVVATGLRNPQELAFDEFGNLFTGDNNSDSGDKARWVYVVPGSDSGWRMYYQYLPDRGPFNREKIWHPYSKESPAYIVPPIANVADGPSGLAYYPGTGLGDEFRGKFFLCDFRGGPSNSGIRTFRVKPQGAFFQVTDMDQTFWRQLVTDVQFAPDGALYVSDWVNGWDGLGKGRIYRYTNPANRDNMLVAEVQRLLAGGLEKAEDAQLVDLLNSPDQRVRQESQFELVKRGKLAALKTVALEESGPTLARIHALWGIEQLTRTQADKSIATELLTLLESSDDEVRAQAAKWFGDCGATGFAAQLAKLLQDENLRVRYFALMSFGKQQLDQNFDDAQAAQAIFNVLTENADEDPIVRHGAIMAMVDFDSKVIWDAAVASNSRLIQKAAVVALRKLHSDHLAAYTRPNVIDGLDPEVLVEVVRAVHDLPMYKHFPAIARLIEKPGLPEPVIHRALNAAFRIGTERFGEGVARFAANKNAAESMRLEAIEMLKNWGATPSSRDRVLGDWRPHTGARSAAAARDPFRKNLASILSGSPKITKAAIDAAAKLGIKEIEPTLKTLFADSSQNPEIRADSLRALEAIRFRMIERTVLDAVRDPAPAVRIAARDVLSRVNPRQAREPLNRAIQSDSLRERQQAYATLSRMNERDAGPVIGRAMSQLLSGDIPEDTRLDVLMAVKEMDSPRFNSMMEKYQAAKPKGDPLAKYAECKQGGDPENGQKIFFEKASVYCLRCHKVNGKGGDVGPDLSKIGREKERSYLLEAIVNPDAAIAKNFETVMVATDDGLTYSGILKSESNSELVLVSPEGKTIRIEKEFIEQRGAGKSSMPSDLVKNLSASEIRDLVEFLSSLK